MRLNIAAITNPISLCAYVFSVVFGLLAKRWSAKSERPRDLWLRRLAGFLAITLVAGGLFLAWRQQSGSARQTPATTVVQSSSGNQSPNINSSGSGPVTVTSGP